MSVHISNNQQTYNPGLPLSSDLRQVLIDKLVAGGACTNTGKVPYGLFSSVAQDLKLTCMTITCVWRYYIVNHTLEPVRHQNEPVQKLSEEDVEYVSQLVVLKLSLYRKEIRDLVLQNTNSTFTSLSVSTIQKTVRERISSIKFTHKRMQRSNKRRWMDTNILYTRNFLNFICSVDPFVIWFIDEASVNEASSHRYYGTSESGSRAVDITTHKQGENYTLFTLIGLNDKCYNEVQLTPTDGNAFINFMHNVCNATNDRGEPVIELGTVILSDCASIHSGYVQTILKPYLDELQVTYYFLSKFSPDTNAAEEYISLVKGRLKESYFQTLCSYHVPTAVLAAAGTIGPDIVYKYFKNVSCNYLNIKRPVLL